MSVSMVRGDDFFAKGYGHARLDPPLNWTSQTPAYLASVGKAFTSALLGVLMTETRNTANRFIAMTFYTPTLKIKKNSNHYEFEKKNSCVFSITTHVIFIDKNVLHWFK